MDRLAFINSNKDNPQAKTGPKADDEPKVAVASAPIDVLDSDLARLYARLHPLLVLTLYALRFTATVDDPVKSLAILLTPLGILQIIYVVICLPPTGSPIAPKSTAAKAPAKGGRGRKAPGKGDGGSTGRTVPAMLAHFLSTLLATPLIYAVLVLFGAPLTTMPYETLLCAAHLSSLAIMPLVYVHGVEDARWRECASILSPIDEVFGATLGAFVGAWAGAVPIPLDWDREWQRWPVTVVTGAYIGWAVGRYLGATILKGKRIDLT